MKKLRDYQQNCVDTVLLKSKEGIRNQLVSLPTGSGKTVVAAHIMKSFSGRKLWMSHRIELIEQSAAAVAAELFDVPELATIGIIKQERCEINNEFVVASLQTLHRRLDRIPKNHFDVIVLDECFPAGTLVDDRPIETIKVGDCVQSFNHTINKIEPKQVLNIFKKSATTDLLKVTLLNGISFVCTEEHPIYTKEYGYKTANFILSCISKSDVHCLSFISKCASLLQSRFGLSRKKISNRSGRQNTSVKEMEISRQTKNGNFKFVRVASVQVYQRRSRVESQQGSEENFVYNLEVADNNNYFAENILVHNCHIAGCDTNIKSLSHFTPKLLLGISATPTRHDGISLGNIFDEIVFNRDIKFGIDNGYLVELEGIRIKTDISLDKVRTTGGELNASDLEKLVDTPQRNKLIVESWLKYSKDDPTIAFCVDMKHATNLCDTFQSAGINASFVVSDTSICPDRSDRIRRFKSGEITVMCNVGILVEGFDYPAIRTVITARPTKSLTVYIQQVGRSTRPIVKLDGLTQDERITAILASAKPKAKILDIVDGTTRHQLINTWTLDKDKPVKDRLFVTKKVKDEFAEKQRREAKITHERKQDEIVSLIALPKSIKVSSSPRMLEDATPAQMNWLKAEGYDVEHKIYTKRDASELIINLQATEKQCWVLKNKHGYNATFGVTTRGEAEAAFKEIEMRNIVNPIKNRIPISGIL